ncbi:flippase [Rubrobacter aplysinae]|uniref:flippase n=1 Tax=Rubrobacter aplysinae TaxID=909625 RepID=UPI00064C3504|nr:flippase [Rubrobacter aplysinae]
MSASEGEYKSDRPVEPDREPGDHDSKGESSGDGLSGAPSVQTEYGKGEDSYVGRVARGGGISTIGQGTGRVLGFLTQSAVARTLGAAFFGRYTLTMAVANFVNILSQFGFDNGVVRYVSHYRAQGDNERVRGAIIQSVAITLCISLVLAVALFIGAGSLSELLKLPQAAPLMRLVVFALPFFALMSILVWATQGFQTVTYATYVQQILRPLAYFVLVAGVFVATLLFSQGNSQDGGPPTWAITGIYVGFALSMMAGVVLAAYFLRKLYPPLFDRSVKPKYETKELFLVSVPMSIQRITQYTNNWTGVLVLAQFASAGTVGIYQAAFRTATLGTLVRYAFNGIFSPIISNLYSQGQIDDLRRLYKDVTRWTFTGALALFVPVILLAVEALQAFGGGGFTSGWPALVILSGAQLFSTFVGPSPRMLAMTDNQNVVMLASFTGAITGLVATIALAPSFGLLGAAIGVSAALMTENTISLTMVRRRFGFWPFTPEYFKPTAAALIAAAIAYGAKIGFSSLGVVPGGIVGLGLTILVTGAVFEVFYLGLLWLFGLSETDREFLNTYWQVIRRSLRRRNRGGGDTGGTN